MSSDIKVNSSTIRPFIDCNQLVHDGNKLKWVKDFDSLQNFVENTVGLTGKWRSPGGKAKNFNSSNADLSATWYPGKQNSLLFQGKDGELFKNYLLRLLNSINGSVINANANNVHDCSTNSLVLPAPDEVNLSPVKVCELTQYNNVGKKLTDYPDNSISDSRPNNKYPDINECSIVCDCLSLVSIRSLAVVTCLSGSLE